MKIIRLLSLSALFFPILLQGSTDNLPPYSYSGATGPAHWGDLHPAYHLANKGKQQSPVDIVPDDAVDKDLPEISFHYKSTPLKILNNGHTIQVIYEPGSYMDVGDETYELLQFHFHSPSEHTYNGNALEMEVHLVHKNKKGQLGVVGIFLMEGKENYLIKQLWRYAPMEEGPARVIKGIMVDASDFVPNGNTDYFAYSGSLTTPPCTEGVRWHVMKVAKQVSPAQLNKFRDLIGPNARPIQRLNNRIIHVSD